MTKIKVIETRRFFLDMDSLLRKAVPGSTMSVEFRETMYIFHKKVNNLIVEPSKEIFKLPEDVLNKMQEYQHKLYDAGLPLAEKQPERKGMPYRISKEKESEWVGISSKISIDYADAIDASNKMDEDYNNWLNKKISITVNKIPVNQIPSFTSSGSDNNTFLNICSLFAENLPDIDEDDGKEIE